MRGRYSFQYGPQLPYRKSNDHIRLSIRRPSRITRVRAERAIFGVFRLILTHSQSCRLTADPPCAITWSVFSSTGEYRAQPPPAAQLNSLLPLPKLSLPFFIPPENVVCSSMSQKIKEISRVEPRLDRELPPRYCYRIQLRI